MVGRRRAGKRSLNCWDLWQENKSESGLIDALHAPCNTYNITTDTTCTFRSQESPSAIGCSAPSPPFRVHLSISKPIASARTFPKIVWGIWVRDAQLQQSAVYLVLPAFALFPRIYSTTLHALNPPQLQQISCRIHPKANCAHSGSQAAPPHSRCPRPIGRNPFRKALLSRLCKNLY